eukprot:TRINITY_DN25907_c0_g1_i1.p1 TRINITY_DN25907_c0_g1~~TRINITY_DN25907_c0_g1_i1.p1  ORF type:complete len:101 (-),score=4.99 TRINITY_DN25907_c0_g1_i1:149-451(-)
MSIRPFETTLGSVNQYLLSLLTILSITCIGVMNFVDDISVREKYGLAFISLVCLQILVQILTNFAVGIIAMVEKSRGNKDSQNQNQNQARNQNRQKARQK